MLPPVARQFVAGESAATALEHTRRLNADGVNVILNLLGEHYHDRADAERDTDAYLQLLDDIAASPLDACISVKPSQLGLDIDAEVFESNLREIVAAAGEHGAFVWCDMEDHTTTNATLDAFETLAEEYPWTLGQCIQSNLRRTERDLQRLVDVPGKLRLVKGAYDEPESVAYQAKSTVDERFEADIEYLFANRDRGVTIGSHDPAMIEHALDLQSTHDTDAEFQLLMGVREDRQRELASDGHDVWQYAPYGDQWLSYFWRRVQERKENALFAVRAVLSG